MPKKKKAKVNKKVITAALASAAAVGLGVALSDKKTKKNIAKKVKKFEKSGKTEIDSVIKKIRAAKIISEDKLKRISKILSEKESKK